MSDRELLALFLANLGIKDTPYGVIYRFTNLVNGKIYIGQTVDFYQRMKLHRSRAKSLSYEYTNHLYNAIRKWGWENFKIEIVDLAYDWEKLNELEIKWMKDHNSLDRNHGYNMLDDGGIGSMSPEIRERARASVLEGYKSGRLKGPWLGKKRDPETIEKMRQARLGRPSWNKGKSISEEQKEKLRNTKKFWRPVKCIETGIEYSSIKNAAKAINGNRYGFSKALRANLTYKGFHWDYVDPEMREKSKKRPRTEAEKLASSIAKKGKPSGFGRPVMCIETGLEFKTLREAANWCGGKKPNRLGSAADNGNTYQGYHWKRLPTIQENSVTQLNPTS